MLYKGGIVEKVICVSHITCHVSHVTCHLPPFTNANSRRHSHADSSIIHSRLVPDPKMLLNTLFLKKDKKSYILAVIDIYNFGDTHTYIHTDMATL